MKFPAGVLFKAGGLCKDNTEVNRLIRARMLTVLTKDSAILVKTFEQVIEVTEEAVVLCLGKANRSVVVSVIDGKFDKIKPIVSN